MAKILFFGDSLTAYRENVVTASELFAEHYPQHVIVNKGVGGNDTRMARERFTRDVLAEKPDYLIFCFGTNDAAIDIWKQKTTPRIDLEEYLTNLRYFVHEARAAGAKVIYWLSTPMVMTETLKTYYGGEPYTSKGFNFMLDEYLAAAVKLMTEEQVVTVSINRLFKTMTGNEEAGLLELFPDGMHPNSAGQKIIFGELLRAFESIAGE